MGWLLGLLLHRVTGAVVASLFLAESAYLWAANFRPEHREGADAARQAAVLRRSRRSPAKLRCAVPG